MTIYNYRPDNNEFTHVGKLELDPVEGKPMIPAYATTIEPLEQKSGFTIHFVKDVWVYKEVKPPIPNQPNSYSVWDEASWTWVEDAVLKTQFDEMQAKQAKALALSTVTVTTSNGNIFDGNETARINMLSAITVADIAGITEKEWKLADNTVKVITLSELKEALLLSLQRVGEIVIP